MKMAGLDLATRVGWAFGHAEDGPQFGVFALPRTGEDLGEMLAAFDDWLDTKLHKWRPDCVCYERPFLPSAPRNERARATTLLTCMKLYSLCGVAEMVCRRHEIKCFSAKIQSARSFFTGRGGAKEMRVVAAARDRGWMTADTDEADALAVWLYAISVLDAKNGTNYAANWQRH